MKKYIVFALPVLLLFASCNGNPSDDYEDNKGQTVQNTNEATKTNESNNDNKNIITLSNKSAFKVKVYIDSFRNEEVCTLEKGENKELNVKDAETVYYITYFVDVGMEVPWYDTNSFCVAKANENASISTPVSMTTKNCYIAIENKSSESVIFKRGSSELTSYGSSSSILSSSEKGIYEIKNDSFGNFSSFNIITIKGDNIAFPSQITSFEAGNIYTIIIESSNSNLHSALKTITPFNLDTQKQIWSFSDNTIFDTDYPIILRSAYNKDDGALIMGTLRTNSTEIGLKKIDKYGKESILYTIKNITNTNTDLILQKSKVLDFTECADGSVAILLQNIYGTKTINTIICYDFSKKSDRGVKYSYDFEKSQDFPYDATAFRIDSKNKVISTPDGKIAIVGAVLDNGKMKRYFALWNPDRKERINSVSNDFTNYSQGIKTMFTSVYYDGSDFYACGYDNCDFQYQNRTHKGIIYKFSSDLSSCEKIYEKDNAIFLSIDGNGNDWYVCGEYCDNGKILKGCYLSSSIARENKDPIKFSTSANKPYCYFSQVCCYENKIVVGGNASDDFTGSVNTIPLIVAFDRSNDSILWENTSFYSYSNLGSIIPNKINTYIVQLTSNNEVHYASADLLGNEKAY